MIKKISCVFLLVLGASCSPPAAWPPPVNHTTPISAGTPADCQAMCENLRLLHCPAGDPTPKGATCEAVCENTESSGYATENPFCQAHVKTCEAADACPDEANPPPAE
jgi:hypothetical protein